MSYQPEDPIVFLASQGWEFKRKNGQLILTCPFCEKPEKLSMNPEKGTWHCWSAECGEKGNIYQLREKLGLGRGDGGIQSLGQALKMPPKRIPMAQVEALHAALLADPAALAYCTQARGWSLEVVKRFKLGLKVDDRGKWIAYPWLRRGECIGMKFRISPACQKAWPKRFDREPGCQSILFNRDALDTYDEIILTSGEADALALLSLGFENVVATSPGLVRASPRYPARDRQPVRAVVLQPIMNVEIEVQTRTTVIP